MMPLSPSPGWRLFQAALLSILLAVVVVWLATRSPWFGLTLEPHPESGQVRLVSVTDSAAILPVPSWFEAIEVEGQERFELQAQDLMEEPDVLDDYADLSAFMARQQSLYERVQAGTLTLVLRDDDGTQSSHVIQARTHRALGSLPLAFWVQLASGAGGFIIGVWVLVLRRSDPGAWCFAVTGAGLMLSAFAAAVYSTRELAVAAELFRVLTLLNHLGAVTFGMALIGLFLVFPSRLVSLQWLWMLLVVGLIVVAVGVAQIMPGPVHAMYPPILLQSVCILALIGVQWWCGRGRPLELAALRWLGLATLATVSLFVVAAALPALLNVEPFISQGYAFGFFLIIYAGLALGLRRYRLFDLDRWAFHVLLWVVAGLLLVLFDLALIALLKWSPQFSLAAALLVCGFLWLPLRGWLWRKMVERPRPGQRELFNHIIEVALAPSAEDYHDRWLQLLATLFNPSCIEPHKSRGLVELDREGLFLVLPDVLHSPALKLTLADKGRRLFTPRDVALAEEVVDMLRYANENRHAYQQGVQQERRRIAQDLHDDLGSRLLTGMHQPQLSQVRDTIGLALSEMRVIIRGLSGQPMMLEDALAELRQESWDRLEAAGIDLEWPLPEGCCWRLDYSYYRHLLSIMRELVSNIIRHAGASRVSVAVTCSSGLFECEITDDGRSFNGKESGSGHGLLNLKRRVEDLQGTLEYRPLAQGTCTRLVLPLPERGE